MNKRSSFQSMIMGSSDLVASFKEDHSLSIVNKSFLEKLGYSKKELASFGLSRIIHSQYLGDFKKAITNVFGGEVIDNIELVLLASDGSQIYVEGNLFPQREDGKIVAAQGFFRDITERKKAERKIREEQQRTEFFVDLMTHDLTNINQEVLSTFEILLHSQELPPPMEELVKEGLVEVERASSLIANVKKLSSLMTDRPESRPVDAGQALNSAIQRVTRDFREKDLKLESNLELDQYTVLADRYLEDVFYSILNNSMKFTDADEVHVKIEAEPIKHTPFLKIQMSDKGPGIPDHEKDEIFAKLSHRREGVLGLGLGLTLVKKILENYGGRILVKDRVEGDHSKGAKFVLLLRLTEEAHTNESEETE